MKAPDEIVPVRREPYAGYLALNGWTSLFAYGEEEAERYRLELGTADLSSKQVLEIGFGSGAFLGWARGAGAKVAGIERIEALVEAARQAGIEILSADLAEAAAQNPSRFDYIVAFDVFEHLSRDEIAASLQGFERMLKPGGEAVIRFPNAQSPFGLPLQHGDMTHRTALAPMHFVQLCTGTPLELVYHGRSKMPTGRFGARKLVRLARLGAQALIERSLKFIYGYGSFLTLAPTVTIKLRKRSG